MPRVSSASSHTQDGFDRRPFASCGRHTLPPATPNMAPPERPGAGPREEVGVTGTEAEQGSELRQ